MLNMDSLTIIEINPREVAKMKKNKEGIMIKAKNNRWYRIISDTSKDSSKLNKK